MVASLGAIPSTHLSHKKLKFRDIKYLICLMNERMLADSYEFFALIK
jgi:hypothetical protein